MNDRTDHATDADDDWLDAVLRADGREHRAAYLDDDGFTARVMAALPAPATLPAWRKPALTRSGPAAGIGIAFALPAAVVDVAHEIAARDPRAAGVVDRQIAGGRGDRSASRTWAARLGVRCSSSRD